MDIFGSCIDGNLNFEPLTFPSRSISGASISTSGPLMPTLGPVKSPSTVGPFRFKSKSGMDTFGKLIFIDGILKFGPFSFPSGPSISTSGPEPEIPNLGILNLGILNFPSGPFKLTSGVSTSKFGPSISNSGPLISILGPFKPPSSLGPFRFRSTSGMDIFGSCIDGILNFGPLTLPSTSISGASRYINVYFR
ncbi:unnamed protein product [Ranitomeya imitator]|uniref:Uncharacterized protein n=1 Tax=Ranitomeya imitator TaxID=111125 RepID=A0ABN9KUE9_9NEOB|nr:unnamed protein product [Ranitomeya imitator]